MIVLVAGCQVELADERKLLALEAIEAGHTSILAAQKISSADIHSLVGERVNPLVLSLQGTQVFHLGAGRRKGGGQKGGSGQNESFHCFHLIS